MIRTRLVYPLNQAAPGRAFFIAMIAATSDTCTPIRIYVDADACPVKDKVYRVADRHRLVFVVTNSFMRVPRDPLI
jgi:hypothetical protein